MSLCLFISTHVLLCWVKRIENSRQSFAVKDRLVPFFTLNVQLGDLLCEVGEAFLSFLSFKCQLASEWPRGPPSSTLRNPLSVCLVFRGALSECDKAPPSDA